MPGLIPFNRSGLSRRLPVTNEFYNMLDDFFNDDWLHRRSLLSDTFKVDVKEDEKEYIIEADLPGVQKEEVDLSLDNGRLMLRVQRQDEVTDDSKNYIHRERRFVAMERSVYLADADEQGISAKLADGVLRVCVSKKTRASTSRQIEIE